MAKIDVWDVFGALTGLERSTLNDAQRGLLAVCELRQEVNSGGFDSYFRYWGGNSAADAAKALPSLLGEDWANLLKEAMDLLGPQYPIDQATREDRMDERDLDDQFEGLDARYYALEASTDADALLNDYLARTQRQCLEGMPRDRSASAAAGFNFRPLDVTGPDAPDRG